MDRDNAKAYVEFLKTTGFPFTLRISNYTTEIISDMFNIQFVQSMRGKQCFAAYAKVKSDIRNKEKPKINHSSLRYFEHDFTSPCIIPQVTNIDLKSAYASVLYNDGFITEPTFQYLRKIEKMDRLAAVGMLASKKYIFNYDATGKLFEGIKGYSKIVSDNEDFFYYCVKKVQDIMTFLKGIAAKNYLFTWVDGIYIVPDPETEKELKEFLDSINFSCSVETLQNFRVQFLNDKIKVDFLKDGKIKLFNIPARQSTLASDMIQLLTNQKIEQ